MTTQLAGPIVPVFNMADRLRKAREVTGLDRQTFAERVGISRNTVAGAENGHRRPSNLVIRAWAEYSGVPLEWLTLGDEYTPRDSNPEPAVLEHSHPEQHRYRRDYALAA